jgi:hypothetical protein
MLASFKASFDHCDAVYAAMVDAAGKAEAAQLEHRAR